MVSVKHDTDGKVIAYIEYFIVNQYGIPDDNGRWCYVRYLWLWEGCRGMGLVREFLNKEIPKYPNVEKIYWKNDRHNERMKEFDSAKLTKER